MLKTTILATTLILTGAAAQSLAEGYADRTRSLPDFADGVLLLDAERVVYFTGSALVLDDGTTTRDLLTFSATVFASFTIRANADTLLFGETGLDGSGRVWSVPLRAGSARQLASLPFNYDARMWNPELALVSAKTQGFAAPDNDVFAIDVRTGATDRIAAIPGASGPLAVAANGDVYYATSSPSFPTPPGEVDVLRFAARQIAGAVGRGHLTAADATVVVSGLDAAGRLALDSDGDLLASAFFTSAAGTTKEVYEISEVNSATPRVTRLLDLTSTSFAAGTLLFSGGMRGPVLEPFQPAAAVLTVHEVDFNTGASRLRRIAPLRATTTTTARTDRSLDIAVENGPRGGTGLLVLGFDLGRNDERQIRLGGFEQPLFWVPTLGALRPILFDADGRGATGFAVPRLPFPLPLRTQTVFVDATATAIGSTAPHSFVLRR